MLSLFRMPLANPVHRDVQQQNVQLLTKSPQKKQKIWKVMPVVCSINWARFNVPPNTRERFLQVTWPNQSTEGSQLVFR